MAEILGIMVTSYENLRTYCGRGKGREEGRKACHYLSDR